MRKYLYFLIALGASLVLIAVVDGAAGAEPPELGRVAVAILGKTATCVGATLFFLAVNRVLFPIFLPLNIGLLASLTPMSVDWAGFNSLTPFNQTPKRPSRTRGHRTRPSARGPGSAAGAIVPLRPALTPPDMIQTLLNTAAISL